VPSDSLVITVIIHMRNGSREFRQYQTNVLQLKLGCFVVMQIIHKVLTSTLLHQQPINSAAQNNHTLTSLTVSHNQIGTKLNGDLNDVYATRPEDANTGHYSVMC